MANHRSAEKRARQAEKRNQYNRIIKTKVKNAIKKVHAIEEGTENPSLTLNVAKSVIAKAAKKGTLHKRTAARKISKLTKLYNAKVA